MDFAALRDAVRDRCGLGPNDQMATPTNMAAVVNAALHELETRRPAGWPWQYRSSIDTTLVAGQDTYTFSALQGADTWLQVRAARLLYSTVWEPLTPMPVAMLRKTYPSTTPQMPFAWATDGYEVVFGPVPNDTWSVRLDVVVAEPDLVNDTDTPLMPPTFHQAIVDLGAAIQYRRLGNTAGEQLARTDVSSMVLQMLAWSRTRGGPGHVALRDPTE